MPITCRTTAGRPTVTVPQLGRLLCCMVYAGAVLVAAATPATSQEELNRVGSFTNTRKEFRLHVAWDPPSGNPILPPATDQAHLPAGTAVPMPWNAYVDRGDFDGDGLFDDFDFFARHDVGPHRGIDVDPNPADGSYFHVFRLINARMLIADVAEDFGLVPIKYLVDAAHPAPAGGAPNPVVKSHPIKEGDPHEDIFHLEARKYSPIQMPGTFLEFEFTGVHSCERRGGRAVGTDDPADEVCDCACSTVPEPSVALLVGSGLLGALGVGASTATRRNASTS